MKPGPVGGPTGSGMTPVQQINLPQLLRRIVSAYDLENFAKGGEVAASRIANIKAGLERFPVQLRKTFLLQLPQMALGGLTSRAPLIKALVKTLDFTADPHSVVEFFSGGNLSGPIALSDTQRYIQVSDDPLISALGFLPEEFFLELGFSEFTDRSFLKMAPALPADERSPIENIIKLAVPNLRYLQESVQAFAGRPAMAGQADLCLAFFWATDPFLEMETVVRPGGYMVTVDVSNADLKGAVKAAPGPVLSELKEVKSSQVRTDLMAAITKKLKETPGYKELNLRVVIYQKQ
ncbi:MAG: hypothetical protein NT099_02485 [Candidatus Saganbacteria bacterium]|nr:hypothetical protein [Candidatus Saganbacteria bacterium]